VKVSIGQQGQRQGERQGEGQGQRQGQDNRVVEDYPPAYKDLEAKAHEHGAKVKKWYTELKRRLLNTQQSHSEL